MTTIVTQDITQTLTGVTGTTFTPVVNLIGCDSYSNIFTPTITTGSAKTFTADSVTSTFTATAHGYVTGEVGQASTSSALPTGLATSTNYFVIVVDANSFKLATTLANALAGTNLTISNNGTGTQTFTPTALAGGTATMQVSNDGTHYVAQGSTQNITSGSTLQFLLQPIQWKYVRTSFTLTAGSYNVLNNILTISRLP